jgi:hypothetical protein
MIDESDGWYGADRYLTIIGVPGEESQSEMQLSDGRPGARALLTRVAPAGYGSGFEILLVMRDWDIHGIRPGTPIGPVRPDGTNHEGTWGAQLQIISPPGQ